MNPTPPLQPPYIAVVFVSSRTAGDDQAYGQTAEAMLALAESQPGYLGHDSARGADGLGITVSYWTDEAAVTAWKAVGAHAAAQAAGRRKWYSAYTTHVARVERSYGWTGESAAAVAGERPAEAERAGS
jgi:heme-degrading monooxygenase HmoA